MEPISPSQDDKAPSPDQTNVLAMIEHMDEDLERIESESEKVGNRLRALRQELAQATAEQQQLKEEYDKAFRRMYLFSFGIALFVLFVLLSHIFY